MLSFGNPLLGPGFILHIQKLSNLFLANKEGKSFVWLFLDDIIRKWRSFDLEGTQLMCNHWLRDLCQCIFNGCIHSGIIRKI